MHKAPTVRARFYSAAYVLSYLVVANLPFWLARSAGALLPLGWFCLEFLAVGLLGLFLPAWITTLLLFLVTAADLLSGVSNTYYLSAWECLEFLPSLRSMAPEHVTLAALAAVITLLCCCIPFLFRRNRLRPLRGQLVAVLLSLLVLATVADGVGLVRDRRSARQHTAQPALVQAQRFRDYQFLWLGRYPFLRLWRQQHAAGPPASLTGTTFQQGEPMVGASAHALPFPNVPFPAIPAASQLSARPNIVLILVESWGIADNPQLRQALIAPYDSAALQHYDIRQGTVYFHGGTVFGSVRELCSSNLGLRVLGMSAQALSSCLPHTLRALGYETSAFHGMDGQLFDRIHWWQRMGFQNIWFRDRLQSAGLPLCRGTYLGICDAAVAQQLTTLLLRPAVQPQFLYWVTLNSHLPLSPGSTIGGAPPCAAMHAQPTTDELCAWFQRVWQVHQSVAHMAATVSQRNPARPTVFILVGDHAPPFSDPLIRNGFSPTSVPYILLLPR